MFYLIIITFSLFVSFKIIILIPFRLSGQALGRKAKPTLKTGPDVGLSGYQAVLP